MSTKFRTLLALSALAPALGAQNVTTVLKGTALSLKGGAGIDDLTISTDPGLADGEIGPVDVLVTPGKGTTLNGSPDPVTFPGVQSLKVSLGAGSDVLALTDLAFGLNPVTLNAGPGDDEVSVINTTTGPFKFIGASGNDTFELQGSSLEQTKVIGSSGVLSMTVTSTDFRDLNLKSGPEIDVLNWNGAAVDFAFKLNTGGGNDLVTLASGAYGTQSTLKLGPGNDHFMDDDGAYGDFVSVIASAGDDEVVFEDTSIGNALNVKLGSGLNDLTLRAKENHFTVGNSVTITGGSAFDTVTFQDQGGFLLLGEDLVVALKAGANELQANGDLSLGNDLLYTGGGLDDVVDLNGTQVGFDANLVLKGGFNDVILADCSVGDDLRITAGSGDDDVQFLGTTAASIGGNVLISLGGGNNTSP